MFKNGWKNEILTIPNLLSLFRLALIPVYIPIYLTAKIPSQFFTAGIIMAVSCLTDLVDGWIARHFNMVTTLGKILDPLADKITQFSLTVCLSMKYPVLKPILALFVVKELVQLTLGVVHFLHGYMLPGALIAGKVCTTVLFTSLISLVLLPKPSSDIVNMIALTDGILLLFSFIRYIFAYFGKTPMLRDISTD